VSIESREKCRIFHIRELSSIGRKAPQDALHKMVNPWQPIEFEEDSHGMLGLFHLWEVLDIILKDIVE
jgi:hypothetical protein